MTLITCKCINELHHGCKLKSWWWHWYQNTFHLAHAVFLHTTTAVFSLWGLWASRNIKMMKNLFQSLPSSNDSPAERHSGHTGLKLGRTAKPPSRLHLLLLALFMAVVSLGLASSCSGAAKYHCRRQQRGLLHPSTPACTLGSTMRHPIPPQWRLYQSSRVE